MMHENQLPVTADMVRELVESQFPEWVSLPITPVHSEGTVNAIFRIGERSGGTLSPATRRRRGDETCSPV